MSKTEEPIHAYNICALILAILYPRPLSAEEAFAKMENPGKDLRIRTADIEMLHAAGCSWKEISELLGVANPQSTIIKARKYRERKQKKDHHWQKNDTGDGFSVHKKIAKKAPCGKVLTGGIFGAEI